MSLLKDYLGTVPGPYAATLRHMYDVVWQAVPDADEATSYNLPAFTYDGKPFLAIVANARFISIYPFCNLEGLGVDLTAYECTKGSIHCTPGAPMPDTLLTEIIQKRLALLPRGL